MLAMYEPCFASLGLSAVVFFTLNSQEICMYDFLVTHYFFECIVALDTLVVIILVALARKENQL